MEILKQLEESKRFIEKQSRIKPEIALILGSGLGYIADTLNNRVIIPYHKIPHFPVSTVQGHAGQLVLGKLKDKNLLVMQGRIHYYEGQHLQRVTYPVRLMKILGVKKLILTSAVGGINKNYRPADLVIIKDHINFMGNNPLIGRHYPEFGDRFPDMSAVYSKDINKKIIETCKKLKIRAHIGVYIATTGPSYETPSEIKAFRSLGADVVGMSVVPEAIVANQSKIEVSCISYISNLASGISTKPLTHEEVMEVGKIAGKNISKVIERLMHLL